MGQEGQLRVAEGSDGLEVEDLQLRDVEGSDVLEGGGKHMYEEGSGAGGMQLGQREATWGSSSTIRGNANDVFRLATGEATVGLSLDMDAPGLTVGVATGWNCGGKSAGESFTCVNVYDALANDEQ